MLHGSHEFPQSLSHEIFNKTAKISRTGLTSCRFSDVENSDLSRWFPLLGGRSSPNWPHKHFSLLCRHSVHTRLTVSSASFDSFGCTIVSSPAVQPGMVPKLPIWSGTARTGSTRGRFTRHAFMTYTRGPAYRRRAMRRGAREQSWIIGVDVGGTFTDFYMLDEASGAVHTGKRPSTPDNPARAIVDGLLALASRHGIDLAGLRRLSHGTTVGTNALIQRRGGEVVMITTSGFRDLLEIGRQTRPHMYSLVEDHPAAARRAAPPVRDRRADGRGRGGDHRARPRRRRRGGGAGARERRRCVRGLPAVRIPQPGARAPRRRRAPCRPPRPSGLHLVRGPARVPRVRALLHHRAERLPPAGAGPLSLDPGGKRSQTWPPAPRSASTSRAAA